MTIVDTGLSINKNYLKSLRLAVHAKYAKNCNKPATSNPRTRKNVYLLHDV
jgi:hypothetical protein